MNISEQVKELKKYCVELEKYGGNFNNRLSEEIRNAIDTIETLSAKLSTENTEQVADGSQWIAFNKLLPKENQKVIVCRNDNVLEDLFEFELPEKWQKEDSDLIGFLSGLQMDGIAILKSDNKIFWQPLP